MVEFEPLILAALGGGGTQAHSRALQGACLQCASIVITFFQVPRGEEQDFGRIALALSPAGWVGLNLGRDWHPSRGMQANIAAFLCASSILHIHPSDSAKIDSDRDK